MVKLLLAKSLPTHVMGVGGRVGQRPWCLCELFKFAPEGAKP